MSVKAGKIGFRPISINGSINIIIVEFAVIIDAVPIGTFDYDKRLSAIQIVGSGVVMCSWIARHMTYPL